MPFLQFTSNHAAGSHLSSGMGESSKIVPTLALNCRLVWTDLHCRVYVLDHGDVIAKGTPSEVRQDEEVLRAYLGRNAQAGVAGMVVTDAT